MVDSVFGGSVLNCIYGVALLIGALYALFLLFSQGVGDAFDLGDIEIPGLDVDLSAIFGMTDADIDLDTDSSDLSGLSMLAISGFVTAFGAFGLASATLFRLPAFITLIFALIGGVVVGWAAQLFFMRILSQSTSSNIQTESIKGQPAEVTVPITGEGMGQIALTQKGQRITLMARSSSGSDIAKGSAVIVDSVRDNIAYVTSEM